MLVGAGFEGAKLTSVQLLGVNISQFTTKGNRRGFITINEHDLKLPSFKGANLSCAIFYADETRVDEGGQRVRVIHEADFRGSALRATDLTQTPSISKQLRSIFGDASVTLPAGHGPGDGDWPAHWPKFALAERDFYKQWRKWLANPEGYTPPERDPTKTPD